MSDDAAVTVIFTVLNEAAALPRLLDSLAAQTRPPDEVIVCDGGSRDDTVALLHAERRLPLRVIESPGANISQGRNLAIAAAAHPVIACTDAGVRIDPHWLERITKAFAGPRQPAWVGGFFLPDPHSTFEVAMSATVLPALEDIDPARFLPSSRSVAFLKTAWEKAGGYPEWLDYCEDLIFDFNLRAAFGQCAFAPDALVYFRPRSSLRSFFKQYYLYARGDGKANLWLRRHLARYATYLIALPALLAGVGAAQDAIVRALFGLLLIAGAGVYLRAPCRRLLHNWGDLPRGEKIRAALLAPLIRVVGDVAKMIGYPAGLLWRLRRSMD
ncbi:MAG: glycosyltransferase [Chloroflexi bacterium]|nr:glycosyltransferase [Chloroflexota bacterium]MCL5273324.1 glycosyltransferase [Chloroflexota bacterium]